MMNGFVSALAVACAVALTASAAYGADINILYLSKSVDFQHPPVVKPEDGDSVSDAVLKKIAGDMGAKITCTKDAGLVNKDTLANYDLVIFYTQGDLTKAGGQDNAPAMGETGVDELLQWIKDGGAFMGFHSATDTFRTGTEGQPSAYTQMIGGEFRSHGAQFEGILKVVDPTHPTMANVPDGAKVRDEWYLFRNLNREAMRVLTVMDPGEERGKQDMYNIPAYPVIWCSQMGKGRVYSNALGHGNETWTNEVFQKVIVDAIRWCVADGDPQATPNFAEIIPDGDVAAIEGKGK